MAEAFKKLPIPVRHYFFFAGLAGASSEISKLKSESHIPLRFLGGALAGLLGLPVEL